MRRGWRRCDAFERGYPYSVAYPIMIESEIASIAEIIPDGQNTADYLANFSRCSMVLLAYEPQAYRNSASGVFVEAASFGKPIVVPDGTWMAQQIAIGRGAGTTFKEPKSESIVAALLKAVAASNALALRLARSPRRYERGIPRKHTSNG